MKLLVTYRNGKSETYIGVEKIQPIKDSRGATESVYVETFLRASRLEKPKGFGGGVAKMEILF